MVRYGCSAFAAFAISPIFYHSSWLSLLWRRYPDAIACQKCPLTCHLVVAFTLTGRRATLHAWVHTYCILTQVCCVHTDTHTPCIHTQESHMCHTARPLLPDRC